MRRTWNNEDRHPAPRDVRRKENRKLRYEGRRLTCAIDSNGEEVTFIGTIELDHRSLVGRK